jgi:hypothetical protein
MSTHIYPTTTTRLGGKVNSLVAKMQNVRSEAQELKDVADQIASGGNWQALADAWGYDTPTKAETAYNLIGSALADDIKGAFYSQVISRMG